LASPDLELKPLSARRTVGRAVVTATAATVVAYAFTLLQQVLLAHALGLSSAADTLALALVWAVSTTGPIGTTLGSILVPSYVAAREDSSEEDVRRLLSGTAVVAVVIGIALAVVTLVAAPFLAGLLGPGLDAAGSERLVRLLRLTAPLDVLWIAVWVVVMHANARHRYVIAGASFAVPSLPVIAGLLTIPAISVETIAVLYDIGAIAQVLLVVGIDREATRQILSRPDFSIVRALIPNLLVLGAAIALMGAQGVVIRALASLEGQGGVATADYASRLEVAGEQVLLSGLLAVVLTEWSYTALSSGDAPFGPRVGGVIARASGLFVIVGAAVPALAPPVVGLLLYGGRFSEANGVAVGSFLTFMSAGISGRLIVLLTARAYIARRRYWRLVGVGFVAIGGTAVVGLATLAAFGINAVAIAYSAGWIAAAAVSVAGLRVSLAEFRSEALRSGVVGGFALVVAVAVRNAAPESPVVQLALAGTAFAVTVWLVGHVLGLSTVREVEVQVARLAHS